MKKIAILVLLAFYTCSIFAQIVTLNQGKIKQKHYLQKIPYQEIYGHLIVPVTINGKTYNFAFDTGAPLVISDKIFKDLNLNVIKNINTVDALGSSEKMRLILLPEIVLQGIIFRNTPGCVMHENFELLECLGIDGTIGSNMLRNSVVQFDEQNKNIIITNKIKRVLLHNNEYQKMKLSFWGSNPYPKITLQKGENRVVDNVLFDTGDAGDLFTLSLNKLNAHIVDTIAESEGSFGIGAHGFSGKQNHLLLSIPIFNVNGTIFNDVIVTTMHSNNSRISAKLLQYGKITLDYRKKRFYFEPFDNINTNQPTKNGWAIGHTFQNGKMVVGIIWDKKLESQINLEDEILSINGIDTQPMDLCEFLTLIIPDSDKRIYEFRDIKTGEIKTVEIERMK